jgi:hypothetical protein
MPMGQHAWLMHLFDAAASEAANLRKKDDPTLALMISDLDALCARLQAQINGTPEA